MACMVVGASGWSLAAGASSERSSGWSMGDAFKDGCGDDHGDCSCPICRGEVSDELVAMIEKAAAQPGRAMTIDQFEAWLDDL